MMGQASEGDISVCLYSWAHNLLPVVSSKSCNPQSRNLILQLVEKILSNPKARTILLNGAVRNGERLIPPPSFEIFVRLTFPASSARVKTFFGRSSPHGPCIMCFLTSSYPSGSSFTSGVL